MSRERGDVVVATDPFKEEDTGGRPFLVISNQETPFHGNQYIPLALSYPPVNGWDSAWTPVLAEISAGDS